MPLLLVGNEETWDPPWPLETAWRFTRTLDDSQAPRLENRVFCHVRTAK